MLFFLSFFFNSIVNYSTWDITQAVESYKLKHELRVGHTDLTLYTVKTNLKRNLWLIDGKGP